MCGPGSRNSREAQPRRGTPSRRGVAGRVERPEDLSSPLGSSMATLSQSRPTAGHRSQQLQQQTSRPRALQQCQSVLLLLRHGLDHEVPAGFIAWRSVPSTANAGTITKSQHFHFDGGTRPPTTSTKMSAGRAPVGRRWCWCRLTGPGQ